MESDTPIPQTATLLELGVGQALVDGFCTVKAVNLSKILDAESVCCTVDRKQLGKVYDTFGPVSAPYYVLRRVQNHDYTEFIGQQVYFVQELSSIVPPNAMRVKGTDASNRFDEEPAEHVRARASQWELPMLIS